MKILLAVLLCFVLTTSESFALKGGPVYPGGGANIIGRYAGVLRPPFCPLADPMNCPGLNSLGLFTLSLPQIGLGTGAAFIFASGRTLSGTITASGDPNTAALSGVIDTSFIVTTSVSSTGGFTQITCATGAGRVTGKIATKPGAFPSVSSILVKGTASVTTACNTSSSCPTGCVNGNTPYQIEGFKQSNSPQ